MARNSDVGGAIESRRGEIERKRAAGAQYFKVSGEIEVDGVGETAISVSFPVLFVDKPAYSFGPELYPGQVTVIGNLPTASCTVLLWHHRVRDDGSNIYTGAQFAIVTTGPTGQAMIIQWHMEGIGLRGPVEEDD